MGASARATSHLATASRMLLLTGCGLLLAWSALVAYLFLTALPGQSRDLGEGIWGFLSLGPMAGLLSILVSRILSWWDSQWTAARLTVVGMRGIAFGALAVTVRAVATGRWVPGSTAEVILFVATDLVWIPACAIVLATGLALRALRKPRRTDSDQSRDLTLPSPLAVGIIVGAALLSCIGAWQVSPSLSRALEWGRYGFMPPVRLRSLTQVSRKTTLRFPPSARLVEGEFLSGPRSYLIARVKMSAGDVGPFFATQPFHWSEQLTDEPVFTEQRFELMARLGWRISSEAHVASALAAAPAGTPTLGDLQVVVTTLSPQDVNIYLYWWDTEEHWNW